jgi:hypothetical protein
MIISLNHLALVVGSIVLIILLALCLRKDPQLCLAEARTSVIRVLYFEVCIVEQPETERDGHPSTIKHPP